MPAVYQQEVDSLMAAVNGVMPSYEMVRSRLYRARQASISDKRRPQPPPPGARDDGDCAATWDKPKRNRTGAAICDETDCGGSGGAEAMAGDEPNPEDGVEVIEVSAEPEGAIDSGDECSHADSDGASMGRSSASGEEMPNRTESPSLRQADSTAAAKYEESALAAVERRHGIGASVPERGACGGEDRSGLDGVQKWRGLAGSVISGGAAQTSDLPPVEFTTSARGLPIMQVLQYQFRRWKGEAKAAIFYNRNKLNLPNILAYILGIFDDFFPGGSVLLAFHDVISLLLISIYLTYYSPAGC